MESNLVVLNSLLCLPGLWMCICRGRFMSSKTTKPAILFGYRMEFVALLVALVAPVYTEVGIVQVVLVAVIAFRLWLGLPAWRHGQPEHAKAQQNAG